MILTVIKQNKKSRFIAAPGELDGKIMIHGKLEKPGCYRGKSLCIYGAIDLAILEAPTSLHLTNFASVSTYSVNVSYYPLFRIHLAFVCARSTYVILLCAYLMCIRIVSNGRTWLMTSNLASFPNNSDVWMVSEVKNTIPLEVFNEFYFRKSNL